MNRGLTARAPIEKLAGETTVKNAANDAQSATTPSSDGHSFVCGFSFPQITAPTPPP
jgi:hypothetical protein